MKQINNLIKSFAHAFSGIAQLLSQERNARIHVLAASLAVAMGFICGITHVEWCMIVLCIVCVISAEAINTSIERIVNIVSPEYNELAKNAKDIAAAAVLILAMGAGVIGVLIFIPYC